MSDNVQFPQYSADGLPITYVPNPFQADGKPADGSWKLPVQTHSEGPLVLFGLQTVDGVALMEGDRVLVKDQVNQAENGIYVASGGAWLRAPDCYIWEQFVGAVVAVLEGDSPSDTLFLCQANPVGTVGVTPNIWVPVSTSMGTLGTYTPLRAIVTDAAGVPTASITTFTEIAFVSGVTSSIQQQFNALDNKASSAFSIAVAGTNAAAGAQSTADTALSTANSAYALAQTGTNSIAAVASTANAAYVLAQVGTNTGTAAYQLAQTGSNIAYDGYQIAVAGTTIGSLAYAVASSLGNKYVRTTRFASISSTTGAVTLPPNAIVVLDDFGGGVDAVISTLSAGYPTFQHAFTLAGDLVTTSFDAGGNYSLSGAPSAYPVALIYRVRQTLNDFDSTSADIIGGFDVESIDSVEGTANQVYVNGSLGPQFGAVVLSTPQDIAPSSSPVFANVTANGSVETTSVGTLSYVSFDTVNAGTIANVTGRLHWDMTDQTLSFGLAGTQSVLQIGQETLVYAQNNSGTTATNGRAVYLSGATGQHPAFNLASAAVKVQARNCIGLCTEDVAAGDLGYVTVRGLVRDLDTSAFNEGDAVYLSTTPGVLAASPPEAPNSYVLLGIVVKKSATEGIIFVNPRVAPAVDDLSDVSAASPQAGQSLVYNGSLWVNTNPPVAISPSSIVYYLNDIASGTDALNKLTPVPVEFTEAVEWVYLPANDVTYPVDKYITTDFLNRTVIDAGIWRFNTFCSFTNLNREGVSIVEVYTRAITGTETFRFSGTSDIINVTTPTLFTTVVTQGSFTVDLTDKLVAKYYFRKGLNTASYGTLYHSGTAHASFIQTPLALQHNDLSGLQGGALGQFYHVTLDQNNALVGSAGYPSAVNPYATQQDVRTQAGTVTSIANAAYALAQIGTNTGTAAYNLAQSAYSLALTNSPLFSFQTITNGTTFPLSPDRKVFLADSSGGPVVLALPNTTGWTGQMIHVKKVSTDGNTVTMRSSTGTATIDGALDQTFTAPYMSLQVTTDGSNWFIL